MRQMELVFVLLLSAGREHAAPGAWSSICGPRRRSASRSRRRWCCGPARWSIH